MSCPEVSDLEEGEILEYDSVASNYSRSDFGIKNWSVDISIKENKTKHFGCSENKDLCLSEQEKDGYINARLKKKLHLNEKQSENKLSNKMSDLESISSEGEYKSDEDDKYSTGENEYYTSCNGGMKRREKRSSQFYGTVEDIMSEIGETICRKSRCNYKKRKSKEPKQNVEKCLNNTYDAWRRELFSSHLKCKKRKRKGSVGDSGSDLGKYRTEKRKKRKKREVYYEEVETSTKKVKLKDFDEMRRDLLEKLKKQKAEEELKESSHEAPLELENSEIQEIDMLIDCTNYVDNPPEDKALPNDSASEGKGGPDEKEEKREEGEDELDLIKLRLIALASNKKRKLEEDVSKSSEKSEDSLVEEKSKCSTEEVDLDRNELLLRAEALKTALLKKHQRRLNRLKMGKREEVEGSSVNDSGNSLPAAAEKEVSCGDLESGENTCENGKLDADAWKENVERESIKDAQPPILSHLEEEKNKIVADVIALSGNPKKTCSRTKSKRKKRKSISFGHSLKENNEKSETFEEDDRTLRTQLLSDLMKKKSLKDLEKKSVLMDSIQTAANKPSPSVTNVELPKDSVKPLSGVKQTSLKKTNVPKTTKSKPVALAKFPKPEIQRIIVHLGSEDSSDEDSVFPQTPPKDKVQNQESAATESSDTKAGELIQAKYERSVELLLSQARKKIEGEKRITASTLAAPEAVYKHLPPSQRLEYIRLKQKIAERENLRKQKAANPGNSIIASSGQTSVTNAQEYLKGVSQKSQLGNFAADSKALNSSPDNNQSLKSNSDASNSEAVGNPLPSSNKVEGFPRPNGVKTKEISHRLVINKLNNNSTGTGGKSSHTRVTPPQSNVKTAASNERNFLLLPSSQALISKLKLLLKKIKIEKMVEENYEKEISKLKNQLNLFEKKKCEQRFKIKKIWEESKKTYKAIQGITEKTKGNAAAKEGVSAEQKKHGSTVESTAEEKKPEEVVDQEEGKKVSDEPETEISKAHSASDKELKNDEDDDDGGDNTSETVAGSASSGCCPMKYDSPLQVFSKVSDCTVRVDPNVMVCQFDLMGVCKDEECTYQHLRILAK